MPEFMPGLQLCRIFYTEAVRPLLDEAYPDLPHAAARIGPGSEVLGLDTPRSTDHDWGPRLTLLLSPGDLHRHGPGIAALLRDRLPKTVRGWPTHFTPPGARVQVMTPTTGPVTHRVDTTTLSAWCQARLGRPGAPAHPLDWLGIPAQRLAETVAGAVYHDSTGELTALRTTLAWYPDDVWRHVLAAQWTHIAQEEAFPGRALETGDELGSLVVAGRLARHVMRLALLLRRTYPPYSKWLGTTYTAAYGDALSGITDPGRRLDVLCDAYEHCGRLHNDLGLTPAVDATRRPYHDRPYPVIGADRFAAALTGTIRDPALTGRPLIGAVDQFADSTDVLERPDLGHALVAALFADPVEQPS